jgi:hypothetical protein
MSSPSQMLEPPRYNGRAAAPPSAPDAVGLRPRRAPGRFVLALLGVAVVVLVFVTVALRADNKQPVLAVAQPVAVGQQLTSADVVVVRVAVEVGVPVVPAASIDQVVGHTAAVPLVRGALLAPRQVGPAAWPPVGQAVLALPVKAGHAPIGLAAGASVMVLVTPTTGTTGTGGGPAGPSGGAGGGQQALATVVAFTPATDGSGTATVSLLLAQDAAMRLAGVAGGDVSLVLLAPQN